MKSWEPEKVFKKPDFPVVGKDGRKRRDDPARQEQPSQGAPRSGERNPEHRSPRRLQPDASAPNARTEQRPPAARGEVIPGQQVGTPQAWQPGQEFSGASARPVAGEPRPTQDKNGNAGIKPAGPSWIPDQDFSRADFPRKTEPAGNRSASPARPTFGSSRNQAQPSGDIAQAAVPEKILQELILMFPDNAVNQLRNWFWAKPGTPAGNPALAKVAGKERIFIVLATAGKKITEYLFTMMSPNERAQMQQILKTKFKPGPAEILVVRNAFNEAIRGS